MTEDDRISMKAYVDQRFADSHRAIQTALDSSERAVSRANEAADARFASVNEFRNVLTDQQRSLMPRSEYDTAHKNLLDRIVALEAFRYEASGGSRASGDLIGRAIAVIAVLVAAFAVWHEAH